LGRTRRQVARRQLGGHRGEGTTLPALLRLSSHMIIWNALPSLFRGAGVSLTLVVSSVAIGALLGVPIGVGHVYASRSVRASLWLFDRVFRGFPAIVLLFLVFFGVGGLPGIRIPPFVAVVIALGLRSAAYQGQIYRGALEMVERGQADAARSLGFSMPGTIRHVLLPQAARFSLPSLSNEYSVVLKDTALAFTVGVVDLMSRAKFLAMRSREVLAVYLLAAIFYFVLTHAGIALFRLAERRVAIPGLNPQQGRRIR
jgi:polar amino acid transport system permease protein